ncbi:MAG: polysaccharide biosynthesis tyrosine autokinase [Phycisphaeraceae bacterium]|nr:polysaccharide biosynthesis tyrosine autokinase [Phycisphaerales bacterium]MCB9861097.1 polysaccharide biosynthesis tyrosine autokinase [Phycisphaeraceae bacterium]
MTQLPPSRPAPAAPSAAAMKQIDPFKLLRKHWVTLLVALMIGLALGVGVHIGWLRLYPLYRAAAIFEYEEPTEKLGKPILNANEDEMERFMKTHQAMMKSEAVLRAAMTNPRLASIAPNWHRYYLENGTFDVAEAVDDLQTDLSARIESGTSWITMSLLWTEPSEVHGIIGLIRAAYMEAVETQTNKEVSQDTSGLEAEIKDFTDQKTRLQNSRKELLKRANSTVLENRVSEEGTKLSAIKESIIETNKILEASNIELAQFEGHVRTGTFPEQVYMLVEQDPQIMRLTGTVNELESLRIGYRERFLPGHQILQRLEAQLEGARQQLEREKARQLREKLDSLTEYSRTNVSQLVAQLTKLGEDERESEAKLNDLEILRAAVSDIDDEIEYIDESIKDRIDTLSDLTSRTKSNLAGRVSVAQYESVPASPTMPEAKIVIPGVAVLFVLLVGIVIFLRETLDQRIHGASDVFGSTRLRVLGMIPHTNRDRSAATNPSTTFIDEPTSAVAESFRHVRAGVISQLAKGESKSMLVIPCSAKAGATTVAINLAASLASTGMNVLLIDGNVRKPSLHEALNQQRSPGLSEVLSGKVPLADAVSTVEKADNLNLLTAGNADRNAMELLSTPRAAELIAQAKRSYEVVIVDMPPPIVSGDAASLADSTDLLMFVVQAGQDTKGLLTRLRNEFTQKKAAILGVVINKVQPEAGGYLMQNILATQRYRESA